MNNVGGKISKEQCCGCSGCLTVCPKNAITMQFDEQGFLYPDVNCNICTGCDLCVSVCETEIKNSFTPLAYAVKSDDEDVLKQSSSGGISSALCELFIGMGGVVYGVAYNDMHAAVTVRAETTDECKKFCGSKYVQTNPLSTIEEVKKDLLDGKNVLYFGTACHVNGLLSVLSTQNIKTDKLLTVDLICHGVPSPKLFGEYIDFLKKDKRFKRFSFRTKKIGWGNGSISFAPTIFYNNGKEETDTLKARAYLKLFFSNNCLRPSCYNCRYIGINKPGDITIADYWGLKNEHPEFFDSRGVSAVIIHTAKGKRVFDSLTGIERILSTVEKVSRKQGNMRKPSPKADTYEQFWKDYHEKGFIFVMKKYGGYSNLNRLKNMIKNLLHR